MRIFFILNGRNGATYILNSSNKTSLKKSLSFYKTKTFKQSLLKSALKMYLQLLNLGCKSSPFCKLQSVEEVEKYLKTLLLHDIDLNIDNNCSILISPTRDKIIVHHHGEYFQKFAFGESYANVKNEAYIYELLSKPFTHFSVSRFHDYKESKEGVCSFKLSSEIIQGSKDKDIDITSALVELFSVTKKETDFKIYLQDLADTPLFLSSKN